MKEIITSKQNPLIKEISLLKKENRRKKAGVVVVEGEKEVEMAIKAKISIDKVIICEDYKFKRNITTAFSNKIVFNVSKSVFNSISNRGNPDGLIVLANIKEKSLKDVVLDDNSLIIAIEALEKPGNLGAIIRSAEAVGVKAVILVDSKLDIYNPNVIRTSRGSLFSQIICSTDLKTFSEWAKTNNVGVFAATPLGADNYTNLKYIGRTAFLLGNEHNGLSEKALKIANNKIKLPMNGEIDSLNVSVVAAILLYEALRQKS